jgi:hypothetical protein
LDGENCLVDSHAFQRFALLFPFSRPLKYRESESPEKSHLRFSQKRGLTVKSFREWRDQEAISIKGLNPVLLYGIYLIKKLFAIPNAHLYDGQTSVYDLARQSFGGTIRLVEHFRCVTDVIQLQ